MNAFVLLPVALAAEPEAQNGAENETAAMTEASTVAPHESKGLELQPSTIAFQALNFLLLVIILNRILYKPMVKLLTERREMIKKGIENAEKAEGMLKESNQIRQDMIKRASAESHELLEKARKSGEEVKAILTEQAHLEAEKIIKAGYARVEMEKAKTSQELKNMAVNLIVKATEKVLREKLDPEKDRNLILESLEAKS